VLAGKAASRLISGCIDGGDDGRYHVAGIGQNELQQIFSRASDASEINRCTSSRSRAHKYERRELILRLNFQAFCYEA